MDYQIAGQKIRPKTRIARHHLTKYARPLKDFVEHKVAEGRYNGTSEYVRELIREDEKRKARERLDTLLLEGLAGEESPLTREDLDDIRKEAQHPDMGTPLAGLLDSTRNRLTRT